MCDRLCAKPGVRILSHSGQTRDGPARPPTLGFCSAASDSVMGTPWALAFNFMDAFSSMATSACCGRRCRPALKDPKANIDHIAMAVIAVGVSSAMAFLERKRVIHRDVAARNVLVRVGSVHCAWFAV